jgi:FdhD protein
MSKGQVVEEQRFSLFANGAVVACGTCSPDGLHALAAGRLLAEGLLEDQCIAAIDVDERAAELLLAADLRPAAVSLHPPHPHPRRKPPAPPLDELPDLFRELFRRGDERHPEGGVHVVALCDGLHLLHVHTDVGRHNAVDKALGSALLDDADFSRLGLVLSARVSGEIARKAAVAGVAWIASRSLPTTLALEYAAQAGIAIVARAPSSAAVVWQPQHVS